MKLIAISGVHGIGKTTLVEDLGKKLGCCTLRESASYFLETSYPFEKVDSNLQTFIMFQKEVLDHQIKTLEEASKDFSAEETVIVDRTPVDSLAYVSERFGKERYTLHEYYKDYYFDVLRAMKKFNFSYIFFLDFSYMNRMYEWVWNRQYSGDRNPNPFYLDNLNSIMLNHHLTMSRELHIPNLFRIDYTTTEDRLNFIKSVLEGYYN